MATVKTLRKWKIVSGPSKYDFLQSLSFRKRNTLDIDVEMKLQEAKGAVSEVRKISIRAISQKLDPTEFRMQGLEGQLWGFVGSVKWDGTKNTYDIPVIGEY